MSNKQWDQSSIFPGQLSEISGRFVSENGEVINVADAPALSLLHLNRSGKITGYRTQLYNLSDGESFYINFNVAPRKKLIILRRFTPAKGIGDIVITGSSNSNDIAGAGDETFNLYAGDKAVTIESKFETNQIDPGGVMSTIPPSYLFLGDSDAVSSSRIRTQNQLPVTENERVLNNASYEETLNVAFHLQATGAQPSNVSIEIYVELYCW